MKETTQNTTTTSSIFEKCSKRDGVREKLFGFRANAIETTQKTSKDTLYNRTRDERNRMRIALNDEWEILTLIIDITSDSAFVSNLDVDA
jgi:hypothetical protein